MARDMAETVDPLRAIGCRSSEGMPMHRTLVVGPRRWLALTSPCERGVTGNRLAVACCALERAVLEVRCIREVAVPWGLNGSSSAPIAQ